MDINVDSITSLTIWIQLPELDIKYWGMHSLSKLGSVIGIPLKTDEYTKDKSMLKYAQLLVEMQLEGPFHDFIEFANERDVIIRQKIVYEWRPIRRTHCKMFGHTQEDCRKKSNPRKEWRAIPQALENPQQQQPQLQ